MLGYGSIWPPTTTDFRQWIKSRVPSACRCTQIETGGGAVRYANMSLVLLIIGALILAVVLTGIDWALAMDRRRGPDRDLDGEPDETDGETGL